MTDQSLEERVRLLEEDNRELRKLVQRQEDTRQIANMMGRYIYKHELHQDAEFLNTIFADRDDISWEVANFGVFVGTRGVKRTLDAHSGIFEKEADKPKGLDATGSMIMHTLSTPVIEVAGDGKTAKGIWISPGHETMGNPKTGEFLGVWAWTKYGCDFIKVDGQWKLWHYHVYRVFKTPYDKCWTEEWETKQEAAPDAKKPGLVEPDMPTTYDNPYSRQYVAQPIPAAPESYETWGDTFSYGPPGIDNVL